MPLGTLDRRAPSFMRQGPSAISQLVLYSALALFLMVADARFHVTDPLRKTIAALLYPAQWAMVKPVEMAGEAAGYFQALQAAQSESDLARKQLVLQSQRAHQADQLAQENDRLRRLLDLRARLQGASQAAQILYETTDAYSRRVMVDRGQDAGVQPGSPVLDGAGVLGQVTRVYPFISEVTLLIDRDQAIPVVNMRTNARGVAYGDPVASHGGGMELRFVSANADVQENDLLTTSGLDGVYPTGLPVARVVRVERRADSAFARIYCAPVAAIQGAHHVLLLEPVAGQLPQRPGPAPEDNAGKKRGRK
ncbi:MULTISPECIES: rod shape-determining protein MreC [unclassified Simplicispira]|uniref:rod shape-determining protein MreC n=1 Tax=unclassified Simplicispira TaxID=2630407 RepID=UPI000D5F5391|nr:MULTISPECIES: rod shape-determining protein MreC [unclassified Simplicispira]MBH1977342.1 rod shape-determining protein MreC [Comamonadaceae bacterium]PVY57525.1 rod shape-determining protein MreC [Simplicispira sp. 125]REG18469.1 rod shape-determining protein MreC [Simplicispira sp. 110]